MRTFITVKKIRKSDETAKIGDAVTASGNDITANIVVFEGRLHYRLVDVYGVVNPNFSEYNSKFNPSIHAEIRASRHATGTVICTNRGVYADIIATKHMLKDHFIEHISGRNGRVHDIGDGDALDTLLQQHDNVGSGFDNAVGKLLSEDLYEIDPTRLFYNRNIPTEKQLTSRKTKTGSTKSMTVKPVNGGEYKVTNSQTPVTVTAAPSADTAEKTATEPVREPNKTAAPVLEAGLNQLADLTELTNNKPETCFAVVNFLDRLCDGKKLTITLSVSLD